MLLQLTACYAIPTLYGPSLYEAGQAGRPPFDGMTVQYTPSDLYDRLHKQHFNHQGLGYMVRDYCLYTAILAEHKRTGV